MVKRFSSLQLSMALHGFLILTYALLNLNLIKFFRTEKINFEVIEYPKVNNAQLKLQEHKPKEEVKKEAPVQKKVFGVSRKAIVAGATNENAIEVKQGNTVAKENDNLKLEKDDPDSIPIPTDDYLVTSQVALLQDIKIPYPAEAKSLNLEGPVVMDLIIDQSGKVRSAELVRGPGESLNKAALEAVKSFLFRPAKVGEQNVAVKIRYTYRFVLENR